METTKAGEPGHPCFPDLRRITVLGTGMIGTSVGLAARRAGLRVRLSDQDPRAVAEAVRKGAGIPLRPQCPPADVVVIATPPSAVAGVLRDAQERGLGRAYTDIAGVKAGVLADARALGCDLRSFVPGHPMAGSEQSGPAAARANLFAGRRWALCPAPETPAGPVRLVAEFVRRCGGLPLALAAIDHDRIAAEVSHVPHLVSAALAARFAATDETTLAWAGQGLRDTTRIAGGSPALWSDILRHNAEPVAEALEAIARDLAAAARALRDPADPSALTSLLTDGRHGRDGIARTAPALAAA